MVWLLRKEGNQILQSFKNVYVLVPTKFSHHPNRKFHDLKKKCVTWFLPLRPSTQTATCFTKAIIQETGLETLQTLKEPIQILKSNIHRETIKKQKPNII